MQGAGNSDRTPLLKISGLGLGHHGGASSNFNTANTAAYSNQDGGLVDIEGFAMKSSLKNSSNSSSNNGNNNNSGNDSSNNSYIARNDSGGGTIPNSRTSYSIYDEPVTRSRLLVVFNVISLFASVVGALFSFFQAITLFLVFPILLNDPIYLMLTMYQIVFGIVIVLVEMEWTEMIRQLYIFKSWTTRGLVYAYVGMSGLQQQQEVLNRHSDHYYVVYLISFAMIFLGLLYFAMGVVCLKRIRDKKMATYIQLLSNFEMQSAYRKIKNQDTNGGFGIK